MAGFRRYSQKGWTFAELGEFCNKNPVDRKFRRLVRDELSGEVGISELIEFLIANGGRGKIYRVLIDSYKECCDG